MNREIKFRFWYENQKIMSPSLSLDEIVNELSHQSYPNQLAEKRSYTNVMQYTGIKDKNGVEIYEGDILRCHAPAIEEQMVSEVRWSYALLCWDMGNGENTLATVSDWFNDVEVIGNIYENPELLENKNESN